MKVTLHDGREFVASDIRHDPFSDVAIVRIVEQLEVGKSYELTVLRDGARKTLSVTLGDMPEKLALAGRGESEAPQRDEAPSKNAFSEIGIEVQDVTPEVAKQLDFEADVPGVLVNEVNADSPAYEAGIRTGQLIQKVGSQTVSSAEEFRAAIEGLSIEDGILMLVRTTAGARFVVVQR
ncbi:MAG: PDZ domain-containing protein [Planctomycetales bacterium]